MPSSCPAASLRQPWPSVPRADATATIRPAHYGRVGKTSRQARSIPGHAREARYCGTSQYSPPAVPTYPHRPRPRSCVSCCRYRKCALFTTRASPAGQRGRLSDAPGAQLSHSSPGVAAAIAISLAPQPCNLVEADLAHTLPARLLSSGRAPASEIRRACAARAPTAASSAHYCQCRPPCPSFPLRPGRPPANCPPPLYP